MIRCLLFISLLIHSTAAKGNPSKSAAKKWLTLDGQAPAVVARGGFSGLFPESSDFANQMAISSTVGNVVLLCNLQMTKDGSGICLPDVNLNTTTNIDSVFPNQSTTYNVNGRSVNGWFSFDYTGQQLYDNITLVQQTLSRPDAFDFQYPISGVDSIFGVHAPATWINVQYDQVYTQHKLSMASLILELGLQSIDYISSPEIGFLKAIQAQVSKNRRAKTKLFFVFLQKNETEPTTNQTYGSILGNLASIKPFVSGIVVPKEYIWPLNAAKYLEAPTSLVNDAHKQGLQVYVSGFGNDFVVAHNYSYDPSAEYLQFIDNSKFSVDGLVTDFPPTAMQVVSCFAAYNATKPRKGQPLIITMNGASGVYAGSTDLAYQQAIEDGADVIDCSVQISQDGVAFCLDSVDLTENTNALASAFMSRSATIPEIKNTPGIFSFDLTWSEIQTLQPQLLSPFGLSDLPRNPAYKNAGKFQTLAEFLALAKAKSVSGILVKIENAAYLASKKGIDIVAAVSSALANATLDRQATQQVLIQSDDTSVLSKFRNVPAYKRVLFIREEISDAPRKPAEEIKKYADAVTLTRYSIIPTNKAAFTENATKVVAELRAANLSVYVSVLRNEFVSLAFDYYADPTIEIATYAYGIQVDGIVTEFPATASRFFRNPCSDVTNTKLPYNILPADPGSLLSLLTGPSLPPASAPLPALNVGDVVDPPLPEVANVSKTDSSTAATPEAHHSGALATVASVGFSVFAMLVLILHSIGN